MNLPKLIATFFGSGLLKPAPGTWGSLATLPFAWGLIWAADGDTMRTILFLGAAVVVSAASGWWATAKYLEQTGAHDPGEVVIDEVAGQFLTFLVAAPFMPLYRLDVFVAAFVLFRVFDITKIWPASWADGKLAGATGVMLDDLFAGVYAGAVLVLVSQFM